LAYANQACINRGTALSKSVHKLNIIIVLANSADTEQQSYQAIPSLLAHSSGFSSFILNCEMSYNLGHQEPQIPDVN